MAVTVGRKLTVIKMSFTDNKKRGSDPKIVLKLTSELKEDYLQDRPCKLEKGSIELWKVVSVLSGERTFNVYSLVATERCLYLYPQW